MAEKVQQKELSLTISEADWLKQAKPIIAVITLALLFLCPGPPLAEASFPGQRDGLLWCRIPESSPGPRGFENAVELSRGKFLVASRDLKDPNFSKTVVFLIEYSSEGAVGVIINRPTKFRLSEVLPDLEGLEERTENVYFGGPVNVNLMLLMIRSVTEPEDSRHIVKDIYISSSRNALQHAINNAENGGGFRVYAGYAGWSPGQLDREMEKGGWHLMNADGETIFDREPSEIWPDLIRRSSVLWVGAEKSSNDATQILGSNR